MIYFLLSFDENGRRKHKGLRWQPFLLSLEDSEERQRHAENENSQNQRHRTYALFN